MIVNKTRNHLIAEEIAALILKIRPLAARYKMLHYADDTLKACGWMRANKNCVFKRIADEQVQIYEYNEPFYNIQDLVEMLERQLDAYTKAIDSRHVFLSHMLKFLDANLGAKEELSREQFEARQADVLNVLRRAFEFVNDLKDCKDVNYFDLERDKT